MAQVHATRRQVARLSFTDGEVLVTPKDRDIFLISAEKATEACRNAVRHEERIGQFESMFLVPLNNWCVEHADRLRACYIQVPGHQIQVFIVTSFSQFDFELAEEVAALEMKLAQHGWRVSASQLPDSGDESLGTFFNPEVALEVYAKPGSASSESRKQ